MRNSFVRSVLSTPKQRQRFFYFRNGTAILAGALVFTSVTGTFGAILGVLAIPLAYFTVSPIIAFIVCFVEQMLS